MKNYLEEYKKWCESPDFDEETKKELSEIKDNEKEIEDRFYKELEFGTAGLRGVIGAGTNRMNKYTVGKATQGLANYIKEQGTQDKGVAISYDSRRMSKEFSLQTALILNANGIKTYLFENLRPVPELSFAVRELKCTAGVMITASHNPPKYNGYKVYWEDGAQVMPEIASAITAEVNAITDYSTIPTIKDEQKDLVVMLDDKQDTAFIEAVKTQVIKTELVKKVGKEFKIVYTPLCGTGNVPVTRALAEVGFENVIVVPEEQNPDPNFAGIEYPNPEEHKALTRGIALAKAEGADLVIATDPDCDRVGVAVKTTTGDYALLTGNQIGAMLTNYIIESSKEENKLDPKATLVKTIVTSEFGADIARANNLDVINVLTGFKFIGQKIKSFEESGDRTYLFGYEESYGYLVGTHARDKDGVVASLLISEMAAYYYDKGMSLYEGLQELYKKYGYFKEKTISLTLKGIEGLAKIKEIITYFRENDIEEFNNTKVVDLKDYQKGIDDLPKSNVLKYFLEDGSWIAVRPSGTEPKLKFYVAVKGQDESECAGKIANIESDINKIIDQVK